MNRIDTGSIVDLSIIDENGINWIRDLLGNSGALYNSDQFDYDDDTELFLADTDTIEWWQGYISDCYQTDENIDSLANELGISTSDIRARIANEIANDMEDERSIAITVMEEIRSELQ